MTLHSLLDTIILTSINHGHLLQRELTLRPRSSSLDHNSPYPNSNRSSGSHLAIPNPFKTMMSRSSEQLIPDISRSQREASLNTGLSEARSIGILTYDATLLGLRHCSDVENGVLLGATWTKDNLTVCPTILTTGSHKIFDIHSSSDMRPKLPMFSYVHQ